LETFAAFGGPIASCCLLSAPILTIRKLQAARDTGGLSPNYFVFQFLASAFWLIYGLLVSSVSIMVCNGWGVVVAAYCMMGFLGVLGVMETEGRPSPVSTRAEATKKSIITFGGSVAFALILAAVASSSESVASTICGLVSAGLSTAMLASPLESIKQIFAVKSAAILSPVTIGAAIVNCALWVLYGLCRSDPFVITPNSLGLLSSVVLMGLVVRFGTKPPLQPKDELPASTCPPPSDTCSTDMVMVVTKDKNVGMTAGKVLDELPPLTNTTTSASSSVMGETVASVAVEVAAQKSPDSFVTLSSASTPPPQQQLPTTSGMHTTDA